ncbi:MAG: dicarboxylate/amino acid:cation symporter [Myxococcota bacterium]
MQLYTRILLGMVFGVLLGFLVGPNSMLLPQDGVQWSGNDVVLRAPNADAPPVATAMGIRQARVVRQVDAGFVEARFTIDAAQRLRLIDAGVEEAKTLEPGAEVTGFVSLDRPTVRRYARTGQFLVDATAWIGDLFLALIKMVVVPLVFASLVVGVASLGDFRKLGRLGARTLALFTSTTIVALIIGVGLANLVQPGTFMSDADRTQLLASYSGAADSRVSAAADAPSLTDQIIGIVPTNPLSSLANGDMLQIIFFGLMLGVALTLLPTRRAKPVVDFLDGLNEAMVMLVHVAMAIAPYGVAALLFKVVGSTGLSVLAALSVYAILVVAALALHAVLTYGSIVTFGARLNFLGFLGAIRPALLLAFSTSSSSATLPVTKESVEENLNVHPEVSSFVLPLGATVNMDGTALYQGVAAIFIAQIYSIDLSFADQITIVTSATLASVGAAGVPGAGMITLALVLTAIGVPTEGLALVLGVDRLLDMFRTATNVIGDATAATWMARLEGYDIEVLAPGADRDDPNRGFEGRLDEEPHPVKVESGD